MPDDLDKLRELAPKVGAEKARLDAASRAKVAADAALLLKVIEIVRPALPAICKPFGKDDPRAGRGFELVEKDRETTVFESGDLSVDPESIVDRYNIKTILARLEERLVQSVRGSVQGSEKVARQTAMVRAILTLLAPQNVQTEQMIRAIVTLTTPDY